MAFSIVFSKSVQGDLGDLRAYDREMIFDAIEAQLVHDPAVETDKRKLLQNLVPPFEAVPPVWQLRVGAFRVFYDVEKDGSRVYIRAIRRKPSHLTTEEIL